MGVGARGNLRCVLKVVLQEHIKSASVHISVQATFIPGLLLTPSLSELCELVGRMSFSSALFVSAIVNVAECQMVHSEKAAVGVAQNLGAAALRRRN